MAAFTDLANKWYDWSAQLDEWIHEMYTLQMTLDMMVNEWAVKIALKMQEAESLTGLEVTVRDEIDKLNIDIEAMEANSLEVSGEIAEKMVTIEENNAYYNGIVEGMEIELHSFAGTMRETCGDTGALGMKFLDKITEL